VRCENAKRLHADAEAATVSPIPGAGDLEVSVLEPAGEEEWALWPGLTAEKMKECRWLKPMLVGQFEFVEWTPDNHLRHSKFVALREDKKATDVRRET
jgi:ATP-dependent DNA ligase